MVGGLLKHNEDESPDVDDGGGLRPKEPLGLIGVQSGSAKTGLFGVMSMLGIRGVHSVLWRQCRRSASERKGRAARWN